MTKLLVFVIAVGCSGSGSDAPTDVDAAVDRVDAEAIAVDAPSVMDAPPCSATADTCSGETICIAGTCEAAFGRLYDIRALAVTLPTTDAAGYAWDFAGGAPDIFVEISINGVVRATTLTVDNQFSALFAGPYAVQPIGGGSLVLVAWDEDVTSSQAAFQCTADPLTAAQLRTRKLTCTTGGYSLTLTIDPR